MTAYIRLDVYGTSMLAEHGPTGWRLFGLSSEGKRLELNIVVPDFIGENEVEQYLDDLFHESATPAHPRVRRIEE